MRNFRLSPRQEDLFQSLASERQMTSLVEKDILTAARPFVYDTSDWVKLWYDPENKKTSECGQMTAFRAVTKRGQKLWFVFTPKKSRGFHALTDCHMEAMDMAQQSWAERREIRARWREIEEVAKDLRAGRERFVVSIEDAHNSPLCTLGIEGFLAGVGLSRFTRISGRLAAYLMIIEPQLGFVIDQAWIREKKARARQDADRRIVQTLPS